MNIVVYSSRKYQPSMARFFQGGQVFLVFGLHKYKLYQRSGWLDMRDGGNSGPSLRVEFEQLLKGRHKV